MRREILQYGAPILERPAQKVKRIREARPDIKDLVDTIRADARAGGLAAPQIGSNWRIIAVDLEKTYVLINPSIISQSEESELANEQCLSFPMDVEFPVLRAKGVVVRALTPNGKFITVPATGLEARVLQHEIDHINGILFTQRAEETKKILEENNSQ